MGQDQMKQFFTSNRRFRLLNWWSNQTWFAQRRNIKRRLALLISLCDMQDSSSNNRWIGGWASLLSLQQQRVGKNLDNQDLSGSLGLVCKRNQWLSYVLRDHHLIADFY